MSDTVDARYNYDSGVDPTTAAFIGPAYNFASTADGRTSNGIKGIYTADGDRIGEVTVWEQDLPGSLSEVYRVDTNEYGEFTSLESGAKVRAAYRTAREERS